MIGPFSDTMPRANGATRSDVKRADFLSETLMKKRFKVGDRVTWNSEAGYVVAVLEARPEIVTTKARAS